MTSTTRSLLLSLSLLWAIPIHAEYRYMGGTHTFSPLADTTRLTLRPGHPRLLPISKSAQGEIQLTPLFSPTPSTDASAGFVLTADTDTLLLSLSEIPATDYIYEQDRLLLTLTTSRTTAETILAATPDLYRTGKDAVFTLSIAPSADNAHSNATLFGGRTAPRPLWTTDSLPIPYAAINAIGFSAYGKPTDVKRAIVSTPDTTPPDTRLTPRQIEQILGTAKDPYAGYWVTLDYSIDDAILRPGGDYLLALLPATDGGYDIHYMQGAIRNPGAWQPGDLKGHITPTRLPGLYRARWTDAEGQDLDPSATLQFTAPDLLQLTFPTLHATLRLHRLP